VLERRVGLLRRLVEDQPADRAAVCLAQRDDAAFASVASGEQERK